MVLILATYLPSIVFYLAVFALDFCYHLFDRVSVVIVCLPQFHRCSPFAAHVGHALGVVGQRELIASGDCLLGASRQIEGGELACRIGRDAKALR